MHLELIHGFRLSTTFILAIIIMHIYNWYHSDVTGIHYIHEHRLQYTWRIPLSFLSPLADSPLLPFAPLSNPSLLTWNPPCCDRIRLVNWSPLSQPFPQSLPPQNSQNPGCQAPHYDDLKNPASSVRNINYTTFFVHFKRRAGPLKKICRKLIFKPWPFNTRRPF